MNAVHVNPDACIACTTCTVYCPVAAQTEAFPGPRMIGPAYERFRLLGMVEDPSLSWCSNCKNCDIACPQGVSIASINMMARAREYEKAHPHFLRDWIVSHSETLAHLIGPVPAGLKNGVMQNSLVRGILDMIGIDRKAFMPSYAPRRFRTLLKDLRQPKTGRKVALFPGCYVDLYDPQAGLDLVWALNQAGCEVVCPDAFCCCGVPMVASGFMLDAGVNAKRNLIEVKKLKEQGVPVLTACPSCELMFREELPAFFPELVTSLQCDSALVDAQEFLLEAESRGELKLDVKPGAGRYLYHAPCHMRALGIGLPGFELLRRFGVDVRPASAGCCGISGSYGFKKEKHEVSMKVGAELFGVVRESGCQAVATECGTCRLQIAGATGAECRHPVSLLRSLAGR